MDSWLVGALARASSPGLAERPVRADAGTSAATSARPKQCDCRRWTGRPV